MDGITIKHSWSRTPCTTCKFVCHNILCFKNISDSEVGEESITASKFSICVEKVGNSSGDDIIFTNWEQSVVNTTSRNWKVFIHSIAQIRASHSTCKGDRLHHTFIAPIMTSVKPTFWQYHFLYSVYIFLSLHEPSNINRL